MADIFLSYSNRDRETAGLLTERLSEQGWSVFWDRKVPVGQTWPQVIERELRSAGCVVVLWSPASLQSKWVGPVEAAAAFDRGVLLPALLEDAELPYVYRPLEAADLRGWEGEASNPELDRLLSAVRELVESPDGGAETVPEMGTPEPGGEGGATATAPLTRFRTLSRRFYNKDKEVRRGAARRAEALATRLRLEDLLGLAASRLAGERVGAAIGLRAHLAAGADPERVALAVKAGLADRRSRVRYRYAELLRHHPDLVERLRRDAKSALDRERNTAVRGMLARALAVRR